MRLSADRGDIRTRSSPGPTGRTRGFVYVAFSIDVLSRLILGWRAARSMTTNLPLDELDMALGHRGRRGQPVSGLINHSDARSPTSNRCRDNTPH
jgi:transposase InsO family protein